MSVSTLRQNLIRDFGHDLPIAGGGGSSREDPIRVLSTDAETVALTEMRILDDLSQVFGTFWRTLARTLLGPDWPGIEQYKYETVRLTDTEVITERKNQYFDVGALPASAWSPILASVPVGVGRFPVELGWLHIGNPDVKAYLLPDMVVPYWAPAIKATIYVYERDGASAPADVHDPIAVEQFEEAADAIIQMEKGAEAWPDRRPDPRMLLRVFRVGPTAQSATLLALTTAHGSYVKMRATWERDQFVDKVVRDWVEEVLRFVGRGPKPQ